MNGWQDALRQAASRFQGEILWDEPLAKHTYYRIGGPATALVFPKSPSDLELLRELIQSHAPPWYLLGQGSNLLISDAGLPGLVIRMSKYDLGVERLSDTTVRTGASVAVSSFLRRCGQEGWAGLEFLAGIPGSLGGVVFMNGGTHLGEAKDALCAVEVFGWQQGKRTISGDELKFRYRHNECIRPDEVILNATWRYRLEEAAPVKARIDEVLVRRKATQPLEYPSCGSVFKNPRESGLQAWQVVDQLGLRGHQIGQAQISQKHSNWIVNLGGATARDVRALIDLIKTRARDELKVVMEEEVRYLSG